MGGKVCMGYRSGMIKSFVKKVNKVLKIGRKLNFIHVAYSRAIKYSRFSQRTHVQASILCFSSSLTVNFLKYVCYTSSSNITKYRKGLARWPISTAKVLRPFVWQQTRNQLRTTIDLMSHEASMLLKKSKLMDKEGYARLERESN